MFLSLVIVLLECISGFSIYSLFREACVDCPGWNGRRGCSLPAATEQRGMKPSSCVVGLIERLWDLILLVCVTGEGCFWSFEDII